MRGADGGGLLDGAPPGGIRALQRKGRGVGGAGKGRGAFCGVSKAVPGVKGGVFALLYGGERDADHLCSHA